MPASVDGVEIIQDLGKAFAAFRKIKAPGPRLDLKIDLLSGLAQQTPDRALLAQRGQIRLFHSSSSRKAVLFTRRLGTR
jgi:hypothetical protein